VTLDLDCGQAFDPARDEEFFAHIPPRAGVLLVELNSPGAEPRIVRTADLRRAAERLLAPPEPLSKRLNLREVASGVRYRLTGSKFEQVLTLYDNAKQCLPRRYRDLLRLRPPAVLKVNLRNSYPRCYVTRRIRADEGFYFGPFASRRAADAFAEGFLDLFKIRRCQIKIRRDPEFPGCIYSEMKMCLAPCLAGCTSAEYAAEVDRVLETLTSGGTYLTGALERERFEASEALDFERAALLHKRHEKAATTLRSLPEIARRIDALDAVILQRGAEEKTVILFPIRGGALDAPIPLSFDFSGQTASMDSVLRQALDPEHKNHVPASKGPAQSPSAPTQDTGEAAPAPKTSARERFGMHSVAPSLSEHLTLIARWFYSKPRDGEIFFREGEWPYRRIVRGIGRLLAPPAGVPDRVQANPSPPS
jgi:excinuclease ABC subunit C